MRAIGRRWWLGLAGLLVMSSMIGCAGPRTSFEVELLSVEEESYQEGSSLVVLTGPDQGALELSWDGRARRVQRSSDGEVVGEPEPVPFIYNLVLTDEAGVSGLEAKGLSQSAYGFASALRTGRLQWNVAYQASLTIRNQGAVTSSGEAGSAAGFLELFQFRLRFELPAPQPATPEDAAVVEPPFELTWELWPVTSEECELELQIAEGDFGELLHKERFAVTKQETAPTAAPESAYGGIRASTRRRFDDYSFLPFNTTLRWRVRAWYPQMEAPSAWSPASRFRMTMAAPEAVLPDGVEVPFGERVLFRWRPVSVADVRYRIEIRRPEGGWEQANRIETPVDVTELAVDTTRWATTDDLGKRFQWRVRAIAGEQQSVPSDPLDLVMGLRRPVPVQPRAGAVRPLAERLELRWRGPLLPNLDYQLHLSSRTRPIPVEEPTEVEPGLLGFSFAVTADDLGELTWHVVARLSTDETVLEERSEIHRLTLTSPDLDIESPVSGAELRHLDPEFTWRQDPFAVWGAPGQRARGHYQLVVSERPLTDALVNDESALRVATHPEIRDYLAWSYPVLAGPDESRVSVRMPDDLAPGRRYYFRVATLYSPERRIFSSSQQFEVVSSPSPEENLEPLTRESNLHLVMPALVASHQGQPALSFVVVPRIQLSELHTPGLGLTREGLERFDALASSVVATLHLQAARATPDGRLLFGDSHRPLTATGRTEAGGVPYQDRWPGWSPRGRFCLFASNRESRGQAGAGSSLMRLDPEGKLKVLVAAEPGQRLIQPVWSPAGTHLAYVVEDIKTGSRTIWLCTPAGTERRSLVAGENPTFGPEGRTLCYLDRSEEQDRLMQISLSGARKLLRYRATSADERLSHPSLSPDGRHLAFVSDRSGNEDVWVQPLEGDRAPRQLTKHLASDRHPCWTPDARSIIFSSRREGQSFDLYRLHLAR